MPTYRTLSLQHKEATHYLVRFLEDQKLQIRTRGFIQDDGEILQMHMYEVQWGNKKQVSTAVIVGYGTLGEMKDLLVEKRQFTALTPTATSDSEEPRSPTPPPRKRQRLPSSDSNTSPDILPIKRPKRQRQPKQPKQKPMAKVVAVADAPPTDEEESEDHSSPTPTLVHAATPTSGLTPAATPTIVPTIAPTPVATPTVAATSTPATTPRRQEPPLQVPTTLFADSSRILPLMDVIIKGINHLGSKLTKLDTRLKTLEAKQDMILELHQNQPAVNMQNEHAPTPDGTDDDEELPRHVQLSPDTLWKCKSGAFSAGNFASRVLKKLQPHLFGPDNLRKLYNWNGGGQNGKRELEITSKTAIKKYVIHYYPQMRNEETFRNDVTQKVNEHLRRPQKKKNRVQHQQQQPMNDSGSDETRQED